MSPLTICFLPSALVPSQKREMDTRDNGCHYCSKRFPIRSSITMNVHKHNEEILHVIEKHFPVFLKINQQVFLELNLELI